MAGLPITTYKYAISYSDDNSTYGQFSDYTSLSSIATSFSVGSLNNGRYYKIKARAVNALGDGEESEVIGPFRPAYAASATVASATSAPNPVAPNRGVRTFTVTVTPPSIVNFSYAVLQTQLSGGAWTTREANITNTGTTSYTYSATASQTYSARLITYNTDGYSETTQIATNISIPALISDDVYVPAFAGSGYHPAVPEVQAVAAVTGVTEVQAVAAVAAYWDSPPYDAYYTYAAGTYTSSQAIEVNANNYSVTSAYVGNANRYTYGIEVFARSTTGSASICSSTRYFSIAFSNGTTGTYTVQSQLVTPFTNNSGQTWRSRQTGFAQSYGFPTNSHRIQIRGEGSIASGWNPTINVYFIVTYEDRTLQSAFAGSGYHAAVAAVAYVAPVTAVAAVAYQAPVAAYWDNPPYAAYTIYQSY
jgi:hypothetical protein